MDKKGSDCDTLSSEILEPSGVNGSSTKDRRNACSRLEMRDETFAVVNSLFLGIAGIFEFAGYYAEAFIIEPVLKSVNERDPVRIGAYDGYYGIAALNAVYVCANLFVASCLNYMHPKWLMVASASLYTFYFATFQYLNRYLYFVGCACLGLAGAAYNSGYAAYITEFSTRKTIARNQSIFWTIQGLSLFFSGLVYLIITKVAYTATTDEDGQHDYRTYSDSEIRLFFGAVTAICAVSIAMYAFMSRRRVKGCISEEEEQLEPTPFKQQMIAMLRALRHRRILFLVPIYLYIGCFGSFWMSIYPTSMQFTKQLAGEPLLPAYFQMIFCIGAFIMGGLTNFLSKRIPHFGMRPLLLGNVVVHFIIYAIVLVSVPEESTHKKTDQPSLLLQPTLWLCLFLSVLFGIADHANNTLRAVVTSVVLPEYRAQSFAISRLYHALAASILFLISPNLTVYHFVGGLSVLCVLSAILFWVVAGEIINEEKAKLSEDCLEHDDDDTKRIAEKEINM